MGKVEIKRRCCICGKEFTGWGNNPWPVVKDDEAECCDACDGMYVLPARIAEMYANREENIDG